MFCYLETLHTEFTFSWNLKNDKEYIYDKIINILIALEIVDKSTLIYVYLIDISAERYDKGES